MVLEGSWTVSEEFWAILGGLLGGLGEILADLGLSWKGLGRSLGVSWVVLEGSWPVFGIDFKFFRV